MFYFIKPKTILKFPNNHKISEYFKVEFSKESNEHFNKVLKLWNISKQKKSKSRGIFKGGSR